MVTVADRHFVLVARALAEGHVVPFLGAGANLCDRPDGVAWEPGLFAPSGGELARELAERSAYPDPGEPDLMLVGQYLSSVLGEGFLHRLLHSVFDADYQPTSLHRLLARLPAIIRERGEEQLLVLTTNYDVLVERALEEAGERFDVLWYEATSGHHRGLFKHRLPSSEIVPITEPHKYDGLALSERPVVLKLHGSVGDDVHSGSYVVDEDSYIRYLTGPPIERLIPIPLLEKLALSHLLFLGYSMRDWNIRAMFMTQPNRVSFRSWAVYLEPPSEAQREITAAIWRKFNIDILNLPLSDYVTRLAGELDAVVQP